MATALIWPLAWESPYATGAALEKEQKDKKKKKKEREIIAICNDLTHKYPSEINSIFQWLEIIYPFLSKINSQDKRMNKFKNKIPYFVFEMGRSLL